MPSTKWQKIKLWLYKKRKWGIVLAVLLVAYYFILPKTLFDKPTSFVVEDADGRLLSASIASDGQWRFPAPDSIPQKFIDCITTYEDKRFYYHWGVDPLALGRAIKQNISGGKVVSGASTLTMQVIRLSRDQPRTIWQKFIETVLATRLEFSYSKKEILNLYASNAPFGGNVVGLDAAAWRYYGRSPYQLSWGEMATLAVLPNSPSLVHPGKNQKILLQKRNSLLEKLADNGNIDPTTCRLAKLEPLPGEPIPLPQLAPHLLDKFRKDWYRHGKLGDTRLHSTLDANLQQNIIQAVERHHQNLKANGINNAAVLVLDLETGNTLAYVGNVYHPEDPELQSHVDIIQAPRSPGSTLKPLLFAAMLNDGFILPNSLLADVPLAIAGYTPQNFDLGFDGAVPASEALSRSLNVPAVGMLKQYRTERFQALLKKMKITTMQKPASHYGLSLILGGGETTLWELTGAYASLGRQLLHYKDLNYQYDADDIHPPIYNREEKVISNSSPSTHGLLNASSIWFTLQAMEDVMRPGEEMLWQQFSSSQRVAWKTGTSFGFRDGWAIGMTPRFAIGVWTGNADGEGRPGLIGVQTAAPILFEVARMMDSRQWFSKPSQDMEKIAVCRQSGYQAGPNCPDVDSVLYPKSGSKVKACPYHQLIHLDATGKYRVTSNCEAPYNMQHVSWFVLPPTMEFYYRAKHLYKPLPPFKPGCETGEQAGQSMEIIYPRDQAKIYVPIEIDGKQGATVFKATHRDPDAVIFWHLDDEYIGSTRTFHQISLNPSPGNHVLSIIDESGEQEMVRFEILDKKRGK